MSSVNPLGQKIRKKNISQVEIEQKLLKTVLMENFLARTYLKLAVDSDKLHIFMTI